MQALITIISFWASLLLIMPMSVKLIIETAFMLALGTALLFWKKPWANRQFISKRTYLVVVLLTVYLGFCFYDKWSLSPKVQLIASMLHIPLSILTIAVAVVLSVCSVYFLSDVVQQASGIFKARKRTLYNNIIFCFIMAATTVLLSQMMIDLDLLGMGYVKFLFNVTIIMAVVLGIYCLSGEIKISTALGTGLFMVIATANVYVYKFRERLFEPVDIFSIGTAMNVADNYNLFPVPPRILIGWGIWIALFVYHIVCSRPREKHKLSGKQRAIIASCCLVGVIAVALYAENLETYHWHNSGAIHHGSVLDFASKIKEAYVTKPEGYREEHIEEISALYAQNTNVDASAKKTPHIIVIMDEAFSDLSVLGELSTDKEVIPFVSSLRENAISGYALSSVYGGNTANSEYEFLTGNSMAWLSPNTVPYQQYLHSPTYSMVSYLKNYSNYRCIAMHPYMSSGWNRPSVYTQLGFDESLFIEDFPQEQYIRQYISDQEMFETIVKTYEDQHSDPLFLFGVSMQNHGGYSNKDYTPSISLVGYDEAHPTIEQYLSLIHETDKAVEYLISYFENVNDDVIIVFFGDHQPRISDAFYNEIREGQGESLEEQQDRYVVPFFIWANYDIEEAYMECTSLNYLSSYVYDVAGISLPPYNQFLTEMEAVIPVINANGYYSLDKQQFLPFDDASGEEQSWLQLYKQLQYNSIFGKDHRNDLLFPVVE